MAVMGWVFLVIAVVAIALVFWDVFVRGKRGVALAWNLAALVVIVVTGIASGADVGLPWELIGLVAGFFLLVIADRQTEHSRSSVEAT